jgi:membrane associated rhomboid family serine protease
VKMNLLHRVERKVGRFAVSNLTIYLIAGRSFFYLMYLTGKLAPGDTYLSADMLLSGEWWRIFTLPFDPPRQSLLFTLFAWYFFYMLGSTLEAHWGSFRYNAYLLLGCLITVAASFLSPSYPVTNAFLGGSIFLAFATLFPDYQILLFFVLPVRVKWLALITWLGYAYQFALGGWGTRCMVLAAVANFLVFFRQEILVNLRYGRREFAKGAVRSVQRESGPVHRCTTCGITDSSNPEMDFRYCPQCDGQHGYCREHIFSHQHVKNPAVAGKRAGSGGGAD